MALFTDIAASRVAAGRLWYPSLSLDHMGNDWELTGSAFTYYLREESLIAETTPTWYDIYLVTLNGPLVSEDDTYADLRYRVQCKIEGRYSTGTRGGRVRMKIGSDTSSPQTVDSATYETFTLSLSGLTFATVAGPDFYIQVESADVDLGYGTTRTRWITQDGASMRWEIYSL